MSNKFTFYIGILGVSLFAITSIVGGLLIENYSLTSQFISETYAIDTEYGLLLRSVGFIPSGILLTLFAFLGYKKLPQSKQTKIGFYGLAVFYGIATVVVGFFPCDSGCNKLFIDPSMSQIIHNLTGLLTYLFVPINILLIGIGLKKSSAYKTLSSQGIIYSVISIMMVCLFFINSNSEYGGLYQRLVEAVFIIWIITCAVAIKNAGPSGQEVIQSGDIQ